MKREMTFWRSDGNCIVQVGGVRYRLYKSRLAEASEIFHDVFEGFEGLGSDLPVIDTGEQVFDCPLYEVPNVSSSDFETLMFAMDDAITHFESQYSLETVAAILRAAHTLRFTKFRQWAVRQLEQRWSGNLDDVKEDMVLSHAADVILLARGYDVPSILKRAFYEMLRCSDFDQEPVVSVSPLSTPSSSPSPPISTFPLSASDILLAVSIRARLSSAWLEALASPPGFACCQTPAEGEEFGTTCRSLTSKTLSWATLLQKHNTTLQYLHDPLSGLLWLSRRNWSKLKLCNTCKDAWSTGFLHKRSELWSQLDDWLGLAVVADS